LSYVKIILNDTNAVKPNFFNFIVQKKKSGKNKVVFMELLKIVMSYDDMLLTFQHFCCLTRNLCFTEATDIF